MEEPPAGFLCPITMLPMLEPVVTADGQTYERDAIQGWLLTHNTSPATGAVLPHKELAPNFALRKAIETWEETTQMKVPRANIEFPERPIGAGAFKTVYQGSVLIAGQRVPAAVLRIREESIETEVQTFLKLGRHPRLVRFLGQCTEGGDLLLLTEFAEMGSLSDAFEQLEGKLSPAHKRVMTLQICQGMEHLAEMKFIHRDLAARNCLLFAFSEEDVRVTSVKVSDFGLTVRKNYNQTYAVGVEGEARPLRWLAPEALRFNRFSEKTDVFSLGITIYEIYSEGQIPYFDILEKDLVAHVLGGGRPSRAHIGGGCPDDVWQIIEVCWDKDPKKRPRFSELLPMLGGITSPAPSGGVCTSATDVSGGLGSDFTQHTSSGGHRPPTPQVLNAVLGFESRGQGPSAPESALSDIRAVPDPVPAQRQDEVPGPSKDMSKSHTFNQTEGSLSNQASQNAISLRGSRKTIVAGLACVLLIGLAIGIPLAILGSGSGSTAAPSPTGPTSTLAPSQTLYAVKMVFELGMALASFSSDKQVKFREAVAAAADVQTSNVTIDKISKIAGSRRAGESIRVETSINVADANAADTLQATLTPDKINAQLQNVGLPSATILTEGQSEEKEPCSRGFTGPDGQCVKCVAGKFKESAGSADCTLCAESTYSSVAGATSMSTCVDCASMASSPAGSTSSTSCQCNAGYTGPNGGACTQCASGSYKGAAGPANCDSCPSGTYSTTLAATSADACVSCPANSDAAASSASASACRCNAGFSGPNGGTCTICPAGKFKAASGPAACSDCPSGTYSSSSGAVSAGTCVACPTYSASPPGSDASGDCTCNAGYTGPNGGTCTACEEGKYKDSPGGTACEPCAPGFFQGVSDDASAKCLPCAAGKFNGLTSASACIDCPQHFFSPGTLDGAPAVGCTRCDVEGYTTTPGVAAVSRDNCVVCDAGFEGELSTGCIPCPAGTYTESIGFGKCIACPEGSTTQARLFSVEDCICRPGYTRFASAAKSRMCRPCPLNTYKPSIGDAACTACPALTEESAQSGIKESIDTCVCVPGASRNLTESAPPLDVCTECPAGKIKASVGPAACMQCMEGLYSASALSTSCTACMPGYYSSIQGATGCKQCSIGKYAEGSGSSSCIVCEAGYFAEAIASPACARCPAGKYSGEPESSFCIACSYGTYAGSKGMTSCRECAAGTFATVMKTICENCTAGHYSKAAMSTCLFCQAGKYQDSMGQTACKECGPGRHTSSVEASDGCPECEAGSFSEGSTYQCTECAVGTYQALEAASTCKACAPGAATQSAGASSIEACKCMPGQTGDYPPFLTPDGTCFYGFWAQGVKYDLEETSLSPHWTLCLEVPYHSPTTLVDLKCGAGGACNEHAVCGTGGKVLVGFRRRGSSSLGAAAMGTTRAKTATADDVFNPILAPSPQEDGANATRLHNHVWWYTTPASFGFSAEKEVQLDEQDVSTSTCAGRVGWALSGAGGFRAGCTCSGCSDDKDLSGSVDGSEFLKVVYWAP